VSRIMTNNERICIQSDAIPAPRFRYSPCVQIGPVVQVSGMVALDPANGQLVSGGPGAETACILPICSAPCLTMTSRSKTC